MAADGHLNFDTKINKKGFQKDAEKLTDSLGKVKGMLKGVAAAAAAAFSVQKLAAFIKESKEAYNVQLEAETKLGQVLRNTTGATQDQIEAVKEWASELQEVGIIGDEITLSGLQELGTYIEEANSLKTLSKVLDDMLAQQYGFNATAESAVTISTMLGKVLEGQTSALSRYGYKFTEAQEELLKYGTEEERVATLAEVVEASVGGMNEALAQTPTGRMKQLSNTMGDVKEQFGEAFTVISTLFLPALQDLAAVLAQAAQLATRLSYSLADIFGVEVTNAAAVTDSINGSVEAQDALTDAVEGTAKAAQKSLAGFDKINKLSASTTSGAGGSGGRSSLISAGKTEKDLSKVRKKLESLITPIQQAWAQNSANFISTAETTFGQIKKLFGSVGDSLEKVWTNGSGERYCSNIIILVTDIIGVIGDISAALDKAWNDSGRGTALIQSYFDRWNSFLELIHAVGDAFRTAWNDGRGEQIFSNILGIITNINNIWTNLRTQFISAWNDGNTGVRIWSGILDIFASISGTVEQLSAKTAEWAKNLDFKPLLESVAGALEALKPLIDNVGAGLVWLYEKVLLPLGSWTISKAVPKFLNLVSASLKVINGVLTAFKPLAKFLFDKFLIPIASWTGGAIIAILDSLTVALTNVASWISENQTLCEDIVIVIGSVAAAIGIVLGAQAIGGLIVNLPILLGMIIAQTTALIANAAAWIAVNAPIIAIVAAIAAVIAIGALLIKHWDEVKEFFSNVWEDIKDTFSGVADWFKEKFSAAWSNIKQAFSKVKEWFSERWNDIKEAFSAVGTWFKEKFQGAWDKICEVFSPIGEWFSARWGDIKDAFSTIGTWFSDTFGGAWDNIKTAFSGVKDFFSGIWTAIKNCFSAVTTWFKDKFSAAWQAVKDVFSTGGAIFEGIADNIAEVFKETVNSLIDGINWVIAQPFNAINWALSGLRDIEILDWYPFDWLPDISIPEIPHLAQGTVVPANYGNYLAMLGDNKREPEVVSPVSTIEKALENVLSRKGMRGTENIHVHVDLDGREIGYVAVKAVNEDNERRGA